MNLEGITVKLAEKGNKESLFPEIDIDKCKYGKITKAAIIEAGTARGRTTIQLIGEDDKGNVLVLETTARLLLNGVMAVAQGAAARWGDDLTQA